eukprot:scaffold27365_cov118-Isochrysis_galbana.AAC.4
MGYGGRIVRASALVFGRGPGVEELSAPWRRKFAGWGDGVLAPWPQWWVVGALFQFGDARHASDGGALGRSVQVEWEGWFFVGWCLDGGWGLSSFCGGTVITCGAQRLLRACLSEGESLLLGGSPPASCA